MTKLATTTEKRDAGLAMVEKLLSPAARDFMDKHAEQEGFCSEISNIAIENIFTQFWARPGLDLRARSILTLGILIGLRSADELKVHFGIARKNGLTVTEIEEIIYHATGYAGFPSANVAREAAIAALTDAGVIEAPDHFDL